MTVSPRAKQGAPSSATPLKGDDGAAPPQWGVDIHFNQAKTGASHQNGYGLL
jgi:hypothetical protein